MKNDVQCRTCDHVFPCPALARCELCGSTYLKPYNPCEAMAEAIEGIRASLAVLRRNDEAILAALNETVSTLKATLEERLAPL